jgi:hypothetical protein
MTDDAFEPGKKGRVTEAYHAAYPNPLTVSAGELLTYGRKDSRWPGWVWCINWEGKGGWVPEQFMLIDGKDCIVQRDYTARELSVHAGDLLTLRELESDWYWASDQSGKSGWVPANNVEILDET